MTETKTLAVFGAEGATGKHVVRQAIAAGHFVRAIEPQWSDAPDLPEGVEQRTADVIEDDLAPVIEGCDAIASCIGLPLTFRTAQDPPPLYTEGTRNYLAAMERTGIRRLVVISASFVVTGDRGPWAFRAASAVALQSIFDQMGEMERILRASNVDWTAVRPGWLMEGEETDDPVICPRVIAPDTIRTRHADLARLILNCAVGDEWIRKTPAISRAEDSSLEAAHRLLFEIAH